MLSASASEFITVALDRNFAALDKPTLLVFNKLDELEARLAEYAAQVDAISKSNAMIEFTPDGTVITPEQVLGEARPGRAIRPRPQCGYSPRCVASWQDATPSSTWT